ncbi:chromate transporter [Viridibacillus arvi]|nr:chromate transporter [Viridibacillus sp. JNUCC-6]QOV10081.1 chromate transporter [Viridibacillus sp. JNUCC-6]
MVKKNEVKSQNERPNLRLHRDIASAFFRVGMLGFGGGPSAIPLVHQEVVKKYKWMEDDEFSDVVALANTMPGPIGTKLAGYIGYRIAGVAGAINAILVSVVPTIILMIVLLFLLQKNKDIPAVQAMASAVVPVVAVMLGILALDFVKKSGESMGWKKTIIILLLSFIAMSLLNIHPAFVILAVFIIVFAPLVKRRNNK